MTPSAKRAKAKILVEWIAAQLRIAFPEYPPEAIIVPETYEHGEDLKFSDTFASHFGFSVECKNQRSYGHAYTDMEQALRNSKGRIPIVVAKAPYKEPIVIMRWSDFIKGQE
jgi:hypothetical protein